MLEQTVASLECHGGGDEQDAVSATCCAFSSGMAGVNAIITAHGSSTTVLIPFDLYHGVYTLLVDVLNDLGIQYRRVDFRDIDAVVAEAQTVTTDNVIAWMESPSNPQCHVIDIEGLCNKLQASNLTPKLTTAVDSTMCPPCITQPLRVSAHTAICVLWIYILLIY
jgi:cystathionine gamma-synthase